MGVTALQHRAVTGMFACILAGSRTKSRRRKSRVCSQGSPLETHYGLGLIASSLIAISLGLLGGSLLSLEVTSPPSWLNDPCQPTYPVSWAVEGDLNADSASNIPSLTYLLLLLANDVEVNPGPGHVDGEVLMEGLAQLAVDAPTGL